MGKLEFENLTVVYNNETDYSKRKIKRTRRIEILCAIFSVVVMIAASILCALAENFIIGLIVALVLVLLDILGVHKLMEKLSPPYYEFISWILSKEEKRSRSRLVQ